MLVRIQRIFDASDQTRVWCSTDICYYTKLDYLVKFLSVLMWRIPWYV